METKLKERSSEGWTDYYSSGSRTNENGEVLFEPEDIPQWPEGLNFSRMVISLQRGA